MNKKVLFVAMVAMLMTACGGRNPRLQEPIQEEVVEYRPLVTDSAAIDSIANSGMVDTDAALEIPDIPSDKNIDMNATDDALKDILSGADDDEVKR